MLVHVRVDAGCKQVCISLARQHHLEFSLDAEAVAPTNWEHCPKDIARDSKLSW